MSGTASLMWKIVSPIFITMGTLGNVLVITVLVRPRNRKSSTAVFLTALAVSDLIVLYTGLLRWWLIHLINMDVRLLGDVGCRIHWLLIFASTENSSWLLVAVTCERIISTKWPHKVRILCTWKNALYTVLLITCIIYGGSVHLLYGTELRLAERRQNYLPVLRDTGNCRTDSDELFGNTSETCNCSGSMLLPNGSTTKDPVISSMKYVCAAFVNEGYVHFFNFVYPWIDLVIYFLVPAIIMGIGDVIIIHKILSSRRLRRTMMLKNRTQQGEIMDKSTSITVMLLTVNAVFIFCTTPISVYLIGIPYWVDQHLGFTNKQEIVWACVNLLMYLNHSVNFILYFLSGSRFRQKVYETFWKRKTAGSLQSSSAVRHSESSHGRNIDNGYCPFAGSSDSSGNSTSLAEESCRHDDYIAAHDYSFPAKSPSSFKDISSSRNATLSTRIRNTRTSSNKELFHSANGTFHELYRRFEDSPTSKSETHSTTTIGKMNDRKREFMHGQQQLSDSSYCAFRDNSRYLFRAKCMPSKQNTLSHSGRETCQGQPTRRDNGNCYCSLNEALRYSSCDLSVTKTRMPSNESMLSDNGRETFQDQTTRRDNSYCSFNKSLSNSSCAVSRTTAREYLNNKDHGEITEASGTVYCVINIHCDTRRPLAGGTYTGNRDECHRIVTHM